MADLRALSNTSNRCRFPLKNSSTGVPLTGLTSASAGLIVSTICDNEASATAYTQAGSTIETITTLGTFAAPTATKCRFKEVDATNHPGLYEFQFADARFAVASSRRLVISVSGATNLLATDYEVQLLAFDPYAALATPTNITAGTLTTVTTATNLTNAPSAGDFTATMKTSIGTAVAASAVASVTGNVGGNVTGSVGSVTGNVGGVTGVTFPATVASPTNITAATGIVLSNVTHTGAVIPTVTTVTNQLTAAAIATGIWQDATAGDFTTASSIGKSLYTSGAVPGATGGLFIAGTNAATTVTTSFTTTFTGNLTGSVGSVTGAVGSVTGAVGSVTGLTTATIATGV